MYDGILRLQLPAGCDGIGFADNLALVANKREEVQRAANEVIKILERWLPDAVLNLAPHIMEAVLVRSRKVLETAQIEVCGMANFPAIKHLRVIIDARHSFREHLEYIQGKAIATTKRLARILLKTRDPRKNRRSLLMSVASTHVL